MAAPKIILKKSSVTSRVPVTGDLDYGELAINYADGLIYYKTSSNAIHKFLDSDNVAAKYLQTANLLTAIQAIDGSGSNIDADKLDGQQGSYYLDYNNFTNTPAGFDSNGVLSIVDSAYVNSLIDSVTNATNALTLNSQAPSYYLNYNNFTNTPTNVSTFANDANYLDSTTVTGVINASYVTGLIDATYLDSAEAIAIVDSAYVQLRQDYAYSSLTGVPTNVSTFANDANYLDSTTVTGVINAAYIQSNQITYNTADFTDSAYVASQISTAINNLIDGAPGTLDTLNEIAAALNDDDSAYGTLIGLINGQLDSAEVVALVDSAYVQLRQDYAYSSLTGVPTNVSTFANDANYLDSTTVTGVINSTYVNGLVDSVSNATDALTLNGQASSYYLNYNNFTNTPTTVSTFTNDANYLDSTTVTGVINASYVTGLIDATYLDSAEVISIVDSAYVQARQITYNTSNFTDSAFVTGLPVSTFTNDANYLDSTTVTGVINAAYIQSNQITYNTSDFTDSAYVAAQISTAINNLIDGAPGTLDTLNEIAAALNDDDSAYATLVNLINGNLDSAEVINLIDSAYVQARQLPSTDSAAVISLISSTVDSDYVLNRSAASFPILNQDSSLSHYQRMAFTVDLNSSNEVVLQPLVTYLDSFGTQQTANIFLASAGAGTDSATVITLIQQNTLDSANVITLIQQNALDSSGVQAIVDASAIDSIGRISNVIVTGANAPTNGQALIWDNANSYWKPGSVSSGGGTTGTFNNTISNLYTGDSSTSAFVLSAQPAAANKSAIFVTINGIVQHSDTYSLSGSTVTLDSAPLTGDVIEMRVTDEVTANIQLRDYKTYVYTPSTSTSTFTGADANGFTLTYDVNKLEVYLNGLRLVNTLDYTATTGTSVVLGSPITSGDTLEIVSVAAAAFIDFGVIGNDSDFTTTTANQIVHQFNANQYRTMKYVAQIEHDADNKYHSEEILLMHNGTSVAMTTYAQILMDSSLGTFDADLTGGVVSLKFTPVYTNTSVKVKAIRISA